MMKRRTRRSPSGSGRSARSVWVYGIRRPVQACLGARHWNGLLLNAVDNRRQSNRGVTMPMGAAAGKTAVGVVPSLAVNGDVSDLNTRRARHVCRASTGLNSRDEREQRTDQDDQGAQNGQTSTLLFGHDRALAWGQVRCQRCTACRAGAGGERSLAVPSLASGDAHRGPRSLAPPAGLTKDTHR